MSPVCKAAFGQRPESCDAHTDGHQAHVAPAAEQLKTLAAKTARKAEICQTELTRESAAGGLVSAAAQFLGGLDVLVNNAGDIIGRRKIAEIDGVFWQNVINVNVTSMMWVTRAAVPELIKAGQGSIVDLSSRAPWFSSPRNTTALSRARPSTSTAAFMRLEPQTLEMRAGF